MSSSDPIQKCVGLTTLEWHYVDTYAGNLYEPLNLFLIDADTIKHTNLFRRMPEKTLKNIIRNLTSVLRITPITKGIHLQKSCLNNGCDLIGA